MYEPTCPMLRHRNDIGFIIFFQTAEKGTLAHRAGFFSPNLLRTFMSLP